LGGYFVVAVRAFVAAVAAVVVLPLLQLLRLPLMLLLSLLLCAHLGFAPFSDVLLCFRCSFAVPVLLA